MSERDRVGLATAYSRRTREQRRLRRNRLTWAIIAGEIVALTVLLWLIAEVL